MKRLAIVTTHPIQYYIPLFRLLAKDETIELKVFYTWGSGSLEKFDPGFKRTIQWDIPLLEGYAHEFLENTSSNPGSHHFKGIVNPQASIRIESFRPDAVLIFGWSYHSHLKLIRHFKKGRIPVWFRGDSTLLDKKPLFQQVLRHVFLKWVYSHVDRVFFVGSKNKRYYESLGVSSNKLLFAPHSVDNEFFARDSTESATAFRKSLQLQERDILVLFAGKFEEKKDPKLLLEAVIELNSPAVHLLFVGNGMLEKQLKSDSQASSRNIHFLDFQNQQAMPTIYQSCDLFCLPSKGPGETWGLAVNEAMAAGKAILISDKVGCGSDLVKTGINGETFKCGNKLDLMNKLRALQDLSKLKRYGRKSREIIIHSNLNHVSETIVSELNKLS